MKLSRIILQIKFPPLLYMFRIIVALCIILLLCFWPRIEGLDTPIDIDQLVYDPVEHAPQKKNRIIKTFQLPLPLKSFPPPPKNSSDTTRKELQYISQLSKSPNDEQLKLATVIENGGVLPYFITFAGSNGLIYDQAHLTQVTQDVETLSYLLKSYYNRPRPYQLGFLLGYPINPISMAKTSSYPCEHTLLAKVLAYQLAYNNPKYKDMVHAIAKKIELSRYYSGLNFPSDTVASLKIAEILKDRVQYLET